jgi:hypothetical protein
MNIRLASDFLMLIPFYTIQTLTSDEVIASFVDSRSTAVSIPPLQSSYGATSSRN